MERWYRATGVATRTIVRALDVRLRYTGLENLPRSGPVVLAGNHVSYPDFLRSRVRACGGTGPSTSPSASR